MVTKMKSLEELEYIKPYKGEIHDWEITWYLPMVGYTDCLYNNGRIGIIRGIPHGHPDFVNFIRTSPIKEMYEPPRHIGDRRVIEIETLNSRYRLIGEGKEKSDV